MGGTRFADGVVEQRYTSGAVPKFPNFCSSDIATNTCADSVQQRTYESPFTATSF